MHLQYTDAIRIENVTKFGLLKRSDFLYVKQTGTGTIMYTRGQDKRADFK